MQYDLNDEELLADRGISGGGVSGGDRYGDYNSRDHHRGDVGARDPAPLDRGVGRIGASSLVVADRSERHLHRGHSDDADYLRGDRDGGGGRYGSAGQPPVQSSRRERDEYSPHRGGGNNRRVLNAM